MISLAEKEAKHLINPGSVGQPRDGDPRAGFGIVDTETLRDHDLPHRIPDRPGAGADSRGRPAGGPGPATRARTVGQLLTGSELGRAKARPHNRRSWALASAKPY